MLRTDLLIFGLTGAVFKIAGEMRRLPAYFDNQYIIYIVLYILLLLPKLRFLFLLQLVNSYVMSMVESLSILSLCMFKTVRFT